MTDDIVERLRSRAEAPNAWTRDDFFLIEVADEIKRLTAEGAKLVDENTHLWEQTDKLRDENEQLRAALADATTLACTSWPNCPVAAERERCAKIAEDVGRDKSRHFSTSQTMYTARAIAKAIRGEDET